MKKDTTGKFFALMLRSKHINRWGLMRCMFNESLSEHERNVLKYYQQNKSYEEIAKKLNCKTKSVDTAMTRIRRKANKIKKEVQEEDDK